MTTFVPGKTTGPRVASVIRAAVQKKAKETGLDVEMHDFYKAASISRQHVAQMSGGMQPGRETLERIAVALRKWGHKVFVK